MGTSMREGASSPLPFLKMLDSKAPICTKYERNKNENVKERFDTTLDKIRHEAIHNKVKVTSIGDKISEKVLRWFGYVRRKSIETLVRKVDEIE